MRVDGKSVWALCGHCEKGTVGSGELDEDEDDWMVILRRCAELFLTVKGGGGLKESAVYVLSVCPSITHTSTLGKKP